MLDSIKLKKAMSEIQEILKKNDIGGSVFLHHSKNGHSYREFHAEIVTSTNCLSINPIGAVLIGVDLEKDFQGDKEKQAEHITNTFALLSNLTHNQDYMSEQLKGLLNHVKALAEYQGYTYSPMELHRNDSKVKNN